MSRPGRLSICYLVPGHDLLSTVGPTRNVLNLAQALSEHADVTVAFRRVVDDRSPAGVKVLEIQPGDSVAGTDDAAMRGIGYGDFLQFLKSLRKFTDTQLRPFDVVLEKSWLLSGSVSAVCNRRGQLGVPIENIVVNPSHAARQKWSKLLRLTAARWLTARAMKKAPVVIAETEFLKKEMTQYWGVSPQRIRVVDLGVDRRLFQPLDQSVARQRLGIAADKTVLTYVGILDFTHNLEPAIRAIGAGRHEGLVLHIVGDGVRRQEYGEMAKATGAAVVLHGRVPHSEVPTHIAASDLCLAPYDAAAFSSGELGYSTMKIPEYLAMGRAVVSVPSGRIRTLLRDGETGFLFDNREEQWAAFLRRLASRERLHEMGLAAGRSPLTSWEDTARGYYSICEEHLMAMKSGSG